MKRRFRDFPELAPYLKDMDHIDIKSAESEKDLRTVLVGLIGHCPSWLKGFYKLRGLLARMLGLKHDSDISTATVRPEDISMTPGETARFFTVVSAKEDSWWVGEASDRHLSAWMLLIREQQEQGPARYHVVTSVRHHHWTGPLYFKLILPFHHLIVRSMLRHAVA
ncbi:MAG: DUF2867 domain-containing protein [Desulfovibrionaceae bacterium]